MCKTSKFVDKDPVDMAHYKICSLWTAQSALCILTFQTVTQKLFCIMLKSYYALCVRTVMTVHRYESRSVLTIVLKKCLTYRCDNYLSQL
jgi:hypothetical protein